jgi:hypothetical protein
MTISRFGYIEDDIVKDVNNLLDESNKTSVVMIAESDIFVHTGSRRNITFAPILNSIKVEMYDNSSVTVPVTDINRLITLFVQFKKEFNYTPYPLS